jgi:hypothetical protein
MSASLSFKIGMINLRVQSRTTFLSFCELAASTAFHHEVASHLVTDEVEKPFVKWRGSLTPEGRL